MRIAITITSFLFLLACIYSGNDPMFGAEQLPADITAKGKTVYSRVCQSCHNDTNRLGAPGRGVMSTMSPNAILSSLQTGKMQTNATGLSKEECEAVAQWLAGRTLRKFSFPDSAYTKQAMVFPDSINTWITGWGGNPASTGFIGADRAGISKTNVKTLQLKWAFAFPDVDRVRCRPAIIGDWLITGTQLGDVFALHKKTGRIGWHFKADAAVTGGIQIEKKGDSLKVYFSDYSSKVYALELLSGKLIWKARAGIESQSGVSGAVAIYDNIVYVPLTSYEVSSAMNPSYNCCVSSGGVVALNACTGDIIWTYRVIAEAARASGKTKNGRTIYGPSGAPVWNSPTVDVKRGQLLIGTGENYTVPATVTSDAIQALDLKTGKLLWNYQGTVNDTWNLACPDGVNCPENEGPDLDFGMAPVIVPLNDSTDILVAGQKSGVVHALEPVTGKLIWKKRIGKGGALGGIHHGMATDGRYIYAPNADNIYALDQSDPGIKAAQGLYALDPENGAVIWRTPVPPCQGAVRGCLQSNSAAPLAIPGLVFAGGLDGRIRAYDAGTGAILWSYNALREYSTVNGLRGIGGAMDGSAPVASDGMLYVNAGYGLFGQIPGNVLLAFEVQH